MSSTILKEELVELIPQKPPFRFVDNILELDTDKIVADYRFRPEEFFYAGHFPGNPITPGVILLEAMAQVGIVALGLYLLSLESGKENIDKYVTLFTDAQVEFLAPILPGERIIIRAEKMFWRRIKIRSKVEIHTEDGKLVASGIVSGMGVKR